MSAVLNCCLQPPKDRRRCWREHSTDGAVSILHAEIPNCLPHILLLQESSRQERATRLAGREAVDDWQTLSRSSPAFSRSWPTAFQTSSQARSGHNRKRINTAIRDGQLPLRHYD